MPTNKSKTNLRAFKHKGFQNVKDIRVFYKPCFITSIYFVVFDILVFQAGRPG